MALEEIEEIDLEQFVKQPLPEDPEKLRLSLLFSKDLITTLQQDISDLHHRLKLADNDNNYDGTNDFDDEDDDKAGIHVTNATLTKMDMMGFGDDERDEDEDEIDLYGQDDEDLYKMSTPKNANMYNEDQALYEEAADTALNKKQSEHEKFFSTYNILSKQVNTPEHLIESMGSYQALLHLSDNAVTFNDIIANLQIQLKSAKDSFDLVRDGLNVDDEADEDLEAKLFLSSAKEIMRESKNMVDIIDKTIDELNGAKHLIHPDQKKIFSLQSQIKELQVSLPLHKIKKLAILNELPRFIKQELSDAKVCAISR